MKRRYRFLLLVIAFAISAYLGNLDKRTGFYSKVLKKERINDFDTLLRDSKVINVADADTITVLGSDKKPYKIRLQGIDAPERKQAYGTKCKQTMQSMLKQQRVDIEAYKRDRYKRIVAKVIFRDKDIAVDMIRQGCGWHYTAYADEQSWFDQRAYAKAEQFARDNQLGLWQESEPMAPWDFRRQ